LKSRRRKAIIHRQYIKIMAIRIPVLLLVGLSAISLAEEEVKTKLRNIRIVPTSVDFHEHLGEISEWKLAHGHTIRLEMQDSSTLVLDETGKRVLSIQGPEYVCQAVVSTAGSVLLFSIWSTRGNYSHLVRLSSSEASVTSERIWDSGSGIIPETRWWLHELGAVSDDGKTMLVQLAESDNKTNRIRYRWQTWQTSPAKRLGTGLTIANGRIEKAQ
jgi:hypothetical protein